MTKFPQTAPRRHRLGVVLAVFVLAALTGGGTETASNSPPSASALAIPTIASSSAMKGSDSPMVSYAVSVRPAAFGSRTVILGPKATKRIIAALAAGGTGVALIACQAVVPTDIKPYCGIIISVLGGLSAVGETGERCLSITLTLGMPPVRVSLVPCPVTEPAPVPAPNIFEPEPNDSPAPAPSSPGIFAGFEPWLASL